MHKTLLQKVMHSCKELYLANRKEFTSEEVAISYCVQGYTCKEENIVRAMERRMFELVCIGLLSQKEKDGQIFFSLTEHGRRVATDRIHLGCTLIIRDNKESDVSKGRKSDRKPRKSRAESEAKKECKDIDNAFKVESFTKEQQEQMREIVEKHGVNKNYSDEEGTTIAISTNKGTPKHSIREHIKSLFM